jgi:glycosyltransferase involved in cell wall biosynthesis
MSSKLRSLYICYYPLTEPLVQTQVVAYLSGLAARGHVIHLLTFETEPLTSAEKRQWRQRLKEQGIIWHHLRYHKRPSLPATVYDVMCGVLSGLKIMRRYRLNTVHARAHVPATMGLILKKLTGCRLIFDIRGLMAEEYVDAGTWQEDGLPFRITKNMEQRCITNSDGIVVLTERVKQHLFKEKTRFPVQVIPCCADLTQIEAQAADRSEMRTRLGLDGKTVMVYVGKFGGWYMQREMADFFAAASEVLPELHFLVLSQSEHRLIEEEFARCSISAEKYSLLQAAPKDIGSYLAAADFALSFVEACPSKIASSPTKNGEYLAAGLPIVCNSGIGDMDAIINDGNVGVLIREFDTASYRIAAQEIFALCQEQETSQRCRSAARENASLQAIGIPRYDSLYSKVASGEA